MFVRDHSLMSFVVLPYFSSSIAGLTITLSMIFCCLVPPQLYLIMVMCVCSCLFICASFSLNSTYRKVIVSNLRLLNGTGR